MRINQVAPRFQGIRIDVGWGSNTANYKGPVSGIEVLSQPTNLLKMDEIAVGKTVIGTSPKAQEASELVARHGYFIKGGSRKYEKQLRQLVQSAIWGDIQPVPAQNPGDSPDPDRVTLEAFNQEKGPVETLDKLKVCIHDQPGWVPGENAGNVLLADFYSPIPWDPAFKLPIPDLPEDHPAQSYALGDFI